jgi:hypothetical protein
MRLRWLVPAAAAPWLLAGCLGTRLAAVPFVEAEHERCTRDGSGVLAGRFLLRRPGGGTEPLAGEEVALWPASDYSRAVAAELAAGRRPDPEGKLAPYGRWTRTDGEGGFRFDRLPPCRYVVLARFPGSLSGGRLLGGYAAAEAEVRDGQAANLALDWPPAEPFRAAIRPAAAPAPVPAGPPLPPTPEPSPAGPARDSVADVPVPAGPPALRAPEPNPTGPARGSVAEPCAPYARDPVQRLRCAWVTGPERDRFVPPAGRGASLRTRMDCIPDRDDPGRYAACVARGGRGSADRSAGASGAPGAAVAGPD